eukprot:TRINITY_DN6078_c0_g1_i1.p1 TRINITY_DN6078_c0_g1~~TRINITY_DN6078_c0_g1_i1.p1  ORF type:complete len:290 (-),score=60.58 TRINITY_DN6078_c0_g1_i1:99-968(-)
MTALNAKSIVEQKCAALDKNASNEYDNILELINYIHEKHVDAPELIVKYGSLLIDSYFSKLGNDAYTMCERVFIAALSTHDTKTKQKCLKILTSQFPSSMRVHVLLTRQMEAEQKYEDAYQFYDDHHKDLSTPICWKRKVAIAKEEGNIQDAVDELNKYLDVCSSDFEAWEELTQYYISQEKYELARYCLEELLLFFPQNYLYHLQYAELLYTSGTKEDKETARFYYAQALELNPGNLRSLYGLLLCLRNRPASNDQLNELYAMHLQTLVAIYRKQNPKLLNIVEASVQ